MSIVRDFFPIFDFCGYVTGDVAIFPFENEPIGFFECNGRVISRITYKGLFDMIGTIYGVGNGSTTFAIPDYRGLFLRGVDGGSGRDPNANTRVSNSGISGDNIGSTQQQMLKHHQHRMPIDYNTGFPIPAQGGGAQDWDYQNEGFFNLKDTGGSETRPTNIYVMFAIKY